METPTTTRPARTPAASPSTEVFTYDEKIVRMFVLATALWGFVGMLVGVLIALQLPFWPANLGEYLTFGRLR
ncbi:MAG: cytochrome C oxidase Cbb3, partial [Bacteroidetes bacterium]